MKFPLMRNNILREDLDKVIKHLQQDDPILTNGPKVKEFEKEWSDWLGVKYSVFVNSGASANLISMSILRQKFPQGGEVIVPTLTWVSDISSVIQNGFDPVFVDINPRTLSMDESQVLSKINPNTRAVFLTHVMGFNGLSDKLIEELDRLDVPLIEDVCESHGATHNGKKAGSLGWMSNFSFYYAHHMSTIEGGMVCTNDTEVYQYARMIRSHGMVRELDDESLKKKFHDQHTDLHPNFIFSVPAYNLRNNEIGGILDLSKLKKLDENIKKRKENFKTFLNEIDSDLFQTDFQVEGSSNYAFNIILKRPDKLLAEKLMQAMEVNQIEYRRGSAGGGNQLRQPYLKNIYDNQDFSNFPNVEHIHFFGFYVGNYPDLNSKEIVELCKIINSVANQFD